MEADPDHKYIVALLNDDQKEIEEIYNRYSKIVTSYVLNNSGSVEEAKDLFQETLIDLYRKGQDGFILTCPFKPYFLAMCRYKWLDQLKGDKKRKIKETDAFKVTNLENEGLEYIREEIVHSVGKEKEFNIYREHFSKLSSTCQEIIGLSLVMNEQTNKTNSLKEIAAVLELNYSYVRREKNNCLDKLIASIKQDPRFRQ